MEANSQNNLNSFKLFKAAWLTPGNKFTRLTLKPGQAGIVKSHPLNVRSGPGISFTPVKTLNKDTLVSIIEKQQDWYKIDENQWVSANFIDVSFKATVEKLYAETKVVVPDDIQKNRWGGEAAVNGWELKASVTNNKLPRSYKVLITVAPTGNSQHRETEVAFFLHDSFGEQIRYETVIKGKALLEVTAYEAFTVGAFTEDGTRLELDLNEQEDYPKGFYYDEVADNFKKTVDDIYRSKPVLVKDDPQKNRWGGKSIDKGKELSAELKNPMLSPNYRIEITLSSENVNRPFNGDVAFFLHDSFSDEIRYKKARNGIAKITVTAYEDFTVGAYTDDGTMLELDLHHVKGFPEGFYARNSP